MKNAQILITEDEKNLSFFIAESLRSEGYSVCQAETIAISRQHIMEHNPDLILLDINLPDGNGLEFLKELKKGSRQVNVLLMTAYGSINQAIDAIRLGASDYLTKPFDLEELKIRIKKILETELIKEEISYFHEKEEKYFSEEYFYCNSSKMKELYGLVEKVALEDTPVLIEGESGTGKEMIARLVHKMSPRSKKSLIDVNCASIPEQFIESELFGFEQGAFTGANKKKPGLFEIADSGSIILDEISEMPIQLQVKLLRILETKSLRRLGGINDKKVDFRLIALTNRKLSKLVSEGNFREDLYYRLSVFPIVIPSLREHKEDIIDLANFFIKKFSKGKEIKLSNEAKEILVNYSWPGNVRELRNVIERALIISSENEISVNSLLVTNIENDPLPKIEVTQEGLDLNKYLDKIKNIAIQQALKITNNNQVKAAELLNVPRHVIRYYLDKKSI
ncbi:MAG: sigma-54-dependent transcriptional regulator [Stygiobacter sp.]